MKGIPQGSNIPGFSLRAFVSPEILKWLEFILATPVVLWGGWSFFVRGWKSVFTWNPNMFTLIGLGVGVAYINSVVATLLPDLFPLSFRSEGGEVGTYFAAMSFSSVSVVDNALRLQRAKL